VNPYRIVLADDHSLFRQGLKGILEGTEAFKVVGEAGDGIELLSLLNRVKPHLIILDISMPNLRGIETIPEIKKIHPGVRILVVTMHNDKEYLYQAISQGADGYFLKKDAGTELFSAIERIQKGKVYVSPSLSEDLADHWEGIREGGKKTILTNREKEILSLIAGGKSNKEIADLLFISVHTVERHRANLMEKLNLKKTADLVKYAIEKGYI
jgi:DNA-binding NarL/FixJ family response regulator